MSSEVVIRTRGLGKAYALFDRPEDRLKQMLSLGRRKYYREFWALKEVDLEVRRGEALAVLGRNGAGKSTLLEIITGTLAPTTGDIETDGRIAALLELGTGFNPEFTGRENVFLSASILGLEQAEIERRFDDIAAFADIGDFIDQPVKVYSNGMYARLAFSVAAHVDAEILILDEILAVGDTAFVQKCMRFIREFKERGTIILVTHDTTAAVNICDRAVWLDEGQIRENGPTKEVAENYLASMDADSSGSGVVRMVNRGRTTPAGRKVEDPRWDLIRDSKSRNVLEIFGFDPDARAYGEFGAVITDVGLYDTGGNKLMLLEGGEEVVVKVTAVAKRDIPQPVLGFAIKDRLGNALIGDNTYLTYWDDDILVKGGESVTASFTFQMPLLRAGDYSINAAIADGSMEENVQQHWIHDALFFRVHSDNVEGVMVGVPMMEIKMEK